MGAIMFALLGIQSRRMSKTKATELVFYAALCFTLVTGVFMLFYWVSVDAISFSLMILLGFVAQYTIVHSYQYAKIHLIAPFEYVTV